MLMLMPSCDVSARSPHPSVRWRVATFSVHVEVNKRTQRSRDELQGRWIPALCPQPIAHNSTRLMSSSTENLHKSLLIAGENHNGGLFLGPLSVLKYLLADQCSTWACCSQVSGRPQTKRLDCLEVWNMFAEYLSTFASSLLTQGSSFVPD